jgi:arabinogalactan endo-1,4-beta-galactosidase
MWRPVPAEVLAVAMEAVITVPVVQAAPVFYWEAAQLGKTEPRLRQPLTPEPVVVAVVF